VAQAYNQAPETPSETPTEEVDRLLKELKVALVDEWHNTDVSFYG